MAIGRFCCPKVPYDAPAPPGWVVTKPFQQDENWESVWENMTEQWPEGIASRVPMIKGLKAHAFRDTLDPLILETAAKLLAEPAWPTLLIKASRGMLSLLSFAFTDCM